MPGTAAYRVQQTDEYVLVWGPWHVKGALGVANNLVACCYLAVIWVFGFFPSAIPVTLASMNWSSLVFGGTALFAVLYYMMWGGREYRGPLIEISL